MKLKKLPKNKIGHAIRRVIITVLMLIGISFMINIAPNYEKDMQFGTKLVINSSNVTDNLKSKIIVRGDEVYLSIDDVKNFFDEYILEDSDKIITTSNTKTVTLSKDTINKKLVDIYENGSNIQINNGISMENNKYYLPMTSLANVYNYEIKYNKDSDIISIDSLGKNLTIAKAKKNLWVRYKANIFSKNVDKIKRNERVNLIKNENNEVINIKGFIKVKTQKGIIGYVTANDLYDQKDERLDLDKILLNGNASIVWDYYKQGQNAPNRTEPINGINVVSPSFYELNSNGTINVNYNESSKKYVDWAKSNGYDVWPTLSNTDLNNIEKVSNILSTFETREKLINSIVENMIAENVDGISIDFENMYKEDKDNYSRFIIELAPRLQDIGKKLAVCVTAPDGSNTWSLCYDRNTLGKVSDYLIFIAYEKMKYNQNESRIADSLTDYSWIKVNIEKFLGQEGVSKDKLIVEIPFYTRLWKEENGNITSKVVNMKDVVIPSGVSKKWDDSTKQNYIEYDIDNAKYKMWIEDADSIKEKLNLVNEYQIKGMGFWEKDRENKDVWTVINDKLKPEIHKNDK